MFERGELSASVEHRRQTLTAIAERAKRSETHTRRHPGDALKFSAHSLKRTEQRRGRSDRRSVLRGLDARAGGGCLGGCDVALGCRILMRGVLWATNFRNLHQRPAS